jgi:competence ComEA-like helix-hairpin-helix protein
MNLTQLEKITLGFLVLALGGGLFVMFLQIRVIHGKNAVVLQEVQALSPLTSREIPQKTHKDKGDRPENQKLNINFATLKQLDDLPGVGKVTAEKLIEFRDGKKQINDMSELLEIPGMTRKRINKLAKFLSVSGGSALQNQEVKKLNLNFASEAELQTLPGVGPKLARSIVDTRGKKGSFHSLDDLEEVPGLSERTFRKFEHLVEVR